MRRILRLIWWWLRYHFNLMSAMKIIMFLLTFIDVVIHLDCSVWMTCRNGQALLARLIFRVMSLWQYKLTLFTCIYPCLCILLIGMNLEGVYWIILNKSTRCCRYITLKVLYPPFIKIFFWFYRRHHWQLAQRHW